MNYDRGFYVADKFVRNGAMYYMPQSDDEAACANSINWCDSSISAQRTNTKGVSALASSFDTVSSVTSNLSANMDRIMKTLKELGSCIGVDINDIGDIVRTPKTNFKLESVNRLRRKDLLTLKGN